VLNTRAAGEVTLSRGGRSEAYRVEEAGAEDAIPVLRKRPFPMSDNRARA
jgi:hypothetical protein